MSLLSAWFAPGSMSLVFALFILACIGLVGFVWLMVRLWSTRYPS